MFEMLIGTAIVLVFFSIMIHLLYMLFFFLAYLKCPERKSDKKLYDYLPEESDKLMNRFRLLRQLENDYKNKNDESKNDENKPI